MKNISRVNNVRYIVMCLIVGLHVTQSTDTVHFVHIGKTGGTAFKDAIKQKLPDNWICSGKSTPPSDDSIPLLFYGHGHGFNVGDGSPGDKYIFFVRDPVERWVSGFLSRLRQGCPSHCHRHNKEDKWFRIFPIPNALAEALVPGNSTATKANDVLRHTRDGFEHYLKHLKKYKDDILMVGQMHSAFHDINRFLHMYGIPPLVHPIDFVHHNPKSLHNLTNLSHLGRCNLEEWLTKDYEIMDFLYAEKFISFPYLRHCQRHRRMTLKKSEYWAVADQIWQLNSDDCDKICKDVTKHIERGDLYDIIHD